MRPTTSGPPPAAGLVVDRHQREPGALDRLAEPAQAAGVEVPVGRGRRPPPGRRVGAGAVDLERDCQVGHRSGLLRVHDVTVGPALLDSASIGMASKTRTAGWSGAARSSSTSAAVRARPLGEREVPLSSVSTLGLPWRSSPPGSTGVVPGAGRQPDDARRGSRRTRRRRPGTARGR